MKPLDVKKTMSFSSAWLFSICFLIAGAAVDVVLAQSAPSPRTLDYWIENGTIRAEDLQSKDINQTFQQNTTLDVTSLGALSSLAISGSAEFKDTRSSIRVILVDSNSNEHLIYDTYPLMATGRSFSLANACRETCVSGTVIPIALKIELIDAFVRIDQLIFVTPPTASARTLVQKTTSADEQIRALQNAEIIEQLNANIERRGLRWVAGETSISSLSYAEKKRLLCTGGEPTLPNLQGFDFYKGGIFELIPPNNSKSFTPQSESSLVGAFDWRSRHGANNPNSPYYDGDPSGSGWITSVKGQQCANCWAHCAVGAVEAQANLYFNDHLDLDLSEQHIVSCANAGTCASGGNPSGALRFIRDEGLVDEACFPESGTDEPCTNVCPVPNERIRISNYHGVSRSSDDGIKRQLIDYGPITFGISSWWHCILLVGYQTDSDLSTIWIVKNSWGSGWGENGYGYLKVPLDDLYLLNAVEKPVFSDITMYDVACYDRDGDGFYNWGISDVKPPNCPAHAAPEKDCDDFNARLGPFESNGNCSVIEQKSKVVNDSLTLAGLTTAYDPTAVPDAPAGVFTISATFTNISSSVISQPFLKVVELSGENLVLNADGGPGGVGATLTVPLEGDLADGQLSPGEAFVVELPVGLQSFNPFTFFVDVLGEVDVS